MVQASVGKTKSNRERTVDSGHRSDELGRLEERAAPPDPRSKIDEERAHLLEELRSIEDTTRPLIESYVTAERIESLGADAIVRRLNRLLHFFRDEVEHLWDDAKRLGWEPPGAD